MYIEVVPTRICFCSCQIPKFLFYVHNDTVPDLTHGISVFVFQSVFYVSIKMSVYTYLYIHIEPASLLTDLPYVMSSKSDVSNYVRSPRSCIYIYIYIYIYIEVVLTRISSYLF